MTPSGAPKFVVYIHPASGPITPVAIDLDPVMDMGERNAGPDSTRAMATAVLNQLTRDARLKDAQVNASFDGIKQLIKHMMPAFATYINGIALRVPGSIPSSDVGNPNQGTVQQIQAQLAVLQKQRDDVQRQYDNERMAHNATTQEMERLRIQLLRPGGSSSTELSKVRLQLQDAEARLKLQEGQNVAKGTRIKDLESKLSDAETARAEISVKFEAERARAEVAERERNDLRSKGRDQMTQIKREKEDLLRQIQQHKEEIERWKRAAEREQSGDESVGAGGRGTAISY